MCFWFRFSFGCTKMKLTPVKMFVYGLTSKICTYSCVGNLNSPGGTLPPSCSINVLKNSNCGIFKIVGLTEHRPMNILSFLISSSLIGQTMFFSLKKERFLLVILTMSYAQFYFRNSMNVIPVPNYNLFDRININLLRSLLLKKLSLRPMVNMNEKYDRVKGSNCFAE